MSVVIIINNIVPQLENDSFYEHQRIGWLKRHYWRISTIHKDMVRYILNQEGYLIGYMNLFIYYIKSIFSSITFKIKSISRYNFYLVEDKISKFAQHCVMVNKLMSV